MRSQLSDRKPQILVTIASAAITLDAFDYAQASTQFMTDSNWLWQIFFVHVCQNEGQSESLTQPLPACVFDTQIPLAQSLSKQVANLKFLLLCNGCILFSSCMRLYEVYLDLSEMQNKVMHNVFLCSKYWPIKSPLLLCYSGSLYCVIIELSQQNPVLNMVSAYREVCLERIKIDQNRGSDVFSASKLFKCNTKCNTLHYSPLVHDGHSSESCSTDGRRDY